MSKYVIVGASAAGIGAVEAIRSIDPGGNNGCYFGGGVSAVF